MKDYAFKNSLFQREPIEINKPNQKKDDLYNVEIVDKNLYGRQVAAIQHSVMDTVQQMKDFHYARETQDSPMKAHYERQNRQEEEKLLADTVHKIKAKHAKTGHQRRNNSQH